MSEVKFIKLTRKLLSKRDARDKIKMAYKKVFEGPPWFEKWPLELVEREIKSWEDNCAYGLIGMNCTKIISFIVCLDREINVERDPISWKGPYIQEVGVVPEFQSKGIGSDMVRKFLSEYKRGEYMFRTINPVMIRVFGKFADVRKVGRDILDEYPDRFYYSLAYQHVSAEMYKYYER